MGINMDSRLLSVEQVATYLGKSKQAIYVMVNRGELPYIKLGAGKSGSIRFEPERISALIQSRTVEAFKPVKKGALHG